MSQADFYHLTGTSSDSVDSLYRVQPDPVTVQHEGDPTDLATIPEDLAAEPNDAPNQSAILRAIVGTAYDNDSFEQRFNNTIVSPISLSNLRTIFRARNENKAVDLLSTRRSIVIDDKFILPLGTGQVNMNTDESRIDYQLTVAKGLGFASLLPNARSSHRFSFEMDLQKPYFTFKGKHAMLGFDPAGSMLFLGRCENEDVFLAMAPNRFLLGDVEPFPPGRSSRSAASPVMSGRHYRQMVMMLVHFLSENPDLAYYVSKEDVFEQELDTPKPEFHKITNALVNKVIRLNFEELRHLDGCIVQGYRPWVQKAPDSWRADGFLGRHTPIVVTSRFGQNARIAMEGNLVEEADAWDLERDYSKLAYVTFAIATTIKCTQIEEWTRHDDAEILSNNETGLFDGEDPNTRHRIRLDKYPLFDREGRERLLYNLNGERVYRRTPVVNDDTPPCGVLVDLNNVQAFFDVYGTTHHHEDELGDIPVDVYPLGFLKTAGNIQADGVPPCFLGTMTEINKSVRKGHVVDEPPRRARRYRSESDGSYEEEEEGMEEEEDVRMFVDSDGEVDRMSVDSEGSGESGPSGRPSIQQVVKPVSCQMYNHIAHRIASRAGAHDAQQGTVTAAISGGFADTEKHKEIAREKQRYCLGGLPSDRFHKKISAEKSPTSLRAEVVYSINVGALEDPSGRSIFNKIIVPLTKVWRVIEVRDALKDSLVVLKPKVFPALFEWTAYPITVLIESLYKSEMASIARKERPSPFCVELLAALERTLCFCHTGSAAVLATSLMNPLGLSRGIIKDGFPMLHDVFRQRTISSAMTQGIKINPRAWPTKDGYPAIASRRAQTLTYSLGHFMAYQAAFRIDHASSLDLTYSYTGVSSSSISKALGIAQIAFHAFFDDTKNLVALGVRAHIAAQKSTAPSRDAFDFASSREHVRLAALATWLAFDHPLAYSHESSRDVYSLLLEAISVDEIAVSEGLPNFDHFALSPVELATRLFNMSAPNSPSSVTAPVLRNGSFLTVLKVVHRHLLTLAGRPNRSDKDAFVMTIFLKSLDVFKVDFFPAPKKRSRPTGSPPTKPLFNSWGSLGLADQFLVQYDETSPPPPVAPAQVAFNNAIGKDTNSGWTASSLNINTLKFVLHKTRLPSDFEPTSSSVPYIVQNYVWVKEIYKGSNPIHHLALLVSIIVASSLLPHLFVPLHCKDLFSKASNEKQVREIFQSMDWVEKPGLRGMKNRKIFMVMLTTLTIALYEEKSPLRKFMDENPKNGFGDEWTAKHTKKGVTFVLLIRLGMLWGRDKGAYDRGIFGGSWGCHSKEHMSALYEELKSKLEHKHYGPFDALSLLMGDRNARIFAERLRRPRRPVIAP